MHHLVDTKLEVKIYGREHKCYVLVRDRAGEYEVEISPTSDGRLEYVEMIDREPITSPNQRPRFDLNHPAEGAPSI